MFKPGDIVRCIDRSSYMTKRFLTLCGYTVLDSNGDDLWHEIKLKSNLGTVSWYPSRQFELVFLAELPQPLPGGTTVTFTAEKIHQVYELTNPLIGIGSTSLHQTLEGAMNAMHANISELTRLALAEHEVNTSIDF